MIRCDEAFRLIDDYVDGLLAPEHAAAVAAHLAACERCRDSNVRTRHLVVAAGSLPAEIAPLRDLWPGIATRLQAEVVPLAGARRAWNRPHWTALAAAAALLVATTAVVTVHLVWRPRGGAEPTSERGEATLARTAVAGDLTAAIAEYERAAAALRLALAQNGAALPPATRAVVLENLTIVETAVARLSSALAGDPGNRELALLLTAAYEQQIDLLRTANGLART
jgi:anti-sigma factor ChrR (cupin superfamily)